MPVQRSHAYGGTPTANIPIHAQATEFSEYTDAAQNATMVTMAVPSSTWTVDEIGMNITGMVLGKEVQTVVDGGPLYGEIIKNGANGWAVEVNLDEPGVLFGAYLLVRHQGNPTGMNVSIFGYDETHDRPNATIYGLSTALNSSTSSSWQYHSFGTLPLERGRYFLGIYGENFQTGVPKVWWNRTTSPGSLHVSRYTEGGGWEGGTLDEPFSYKLVIQAAKQYRPSELALQLEVAGVNHSVEDGAAIGTGTLSVSNPAIVTNGTPVEMHVHTNRTATLYLNYTCILILSWQMSIPGFLNATAGSPNSWLLLPSFVRTGGEYHVVVDLSPSWYDVRVDRNGIDATGEVQVAGDTLLIPNAAIIAGATWSIRSRSATIPFDVSLPINTFQPNQTLSLTATPPAIFGQLTFVLYNALGVEEYRESRNHSGSGIESFNRVINANSHEGNACIVVVWKNQTDAGIQARFFSIKRVEAYQPSTFDLGLFGSIVAGVVGAGFVSITAIKRVIHRSRRKMEAERLASIDKLRDLFNLNYIIVLEKKSGIDLYDAGFGGFKMDPTLISGFLSAIKAFGHEMDQADDSQVTKLEYGKSKIVISDYEDFRIATMFKEEPSHGTVAAIDQLSRGINEHYGNALKSFSGETTDFHAIGKLVEEHLHISILAPMRVGQVDPACLSPAEMSLLSHAKELAQKGASGRFYTKDLFASRNYDARTVAALHKLLEGGHLVPLSG
ncbi:MAG: hypothetical protein JW839_10945 [Candidatus Lokiarchaeota archaeon]|nr:hypothetical protein [Candidatus Lokiarchaeota archaeon]